MSDELLRRAVRAIGDLRKIAKVLCDSGFPGAAIRLQGYAAYVQSLGTELDVANQKIATSAQTEVEDVPLSMDADRVTLLRSSSNVPRTPLSNGTSRERRQAKQK